MFDLDCMGRDRARGLLLVGALVLSGGAYADGLAPLGGALGETRWLADLRLRYEAVSQDPPPALLTHDAGAVTLRGRLGFETGKAWNTSLLVEGEFVGSLDGHYRVDNSVPVRDINYPVIADASAHELNRAQLSNTSLPGTTLTLGRQRINLDDQRFIGASGWRQNEQTFDALRVVNRSVSNLTLDATWANRVQRVFGLDSPQGVYKGSMVLANAGYQIGLHKLTAFGYWLDLDPLRIIVGPGVTAATATALNPARGDTATYGLRATGEKRLARVKLGYALSWASQSDYGANTLQLSNHYWLAELSGTYKAFTLSLGEESLQGNGTVGFSTPLATLHKFQGWADKFLTTPANGLDDRYAGLAAQFKGVAGLDTLALSAVWHDYRSERLDLGYGGEWDGQLVGKWRRFTGTLKYANYATGRDSATVAGFGDTRKFWAQLEYLW
jgi:hypothetical protein